MNKSLGWLLIVVGIGAAIDAYHGQAPWTALLNYISGSSTGGVNTNTGTGQGDTNPNPIPPTPGGIGFHSSADSISIKRLEQQAGTAPTG